MSLWDHETSFGKLDVRYYKKACNSREKSRSRENRRKRKNRSEYYDNNIYCHAALSHAGS